MTVFGYLILIDMYLRFYLSVFSLVLVSIERYIKHSRQCMNGHISKHLEVRQKYILSSRCLEMWSNTVFRV